MAAPDGRPPVAEPVYTPETAKVLDEIEADPTRADLWDAAYLGPTAFRL